MEKKIHYCWFGSKPLPPLAIKCIESWKKYFPDYEIIEWNEKNFNVNCNSYVKEAYKKGKYAFVSDYARLKIIYENGGIYFDTDVEVIKRFSNSMLEKGFFGLEGKYINTGLGFSAPKKSKIIKIMLDDYEKIHFINSDGTLDLKACPERNTTSLINKGYNISKKESSIDGIKIYPDEFFNPYDYKTNILKTTANTYSIHHCAASWISDEKRKDLNIKHNLVGKFGKYLGTFCYYIYKIIKIIIGKENK